VKGEVNSRTYEFNINWKFSKPWLVKQENGKWTARVVLDVSAENARISIMAKSRFIQGIYRFPGCPKARLDRTYGLVSGP